MIQYNDIKETVINMEFENMLSYCRELELNNNRSWFHANHKQYEQAKEDFTELVERIKFCAAERVDLALQERLLFAEPKDMLYRIPRDARVYKDKPPYNPTWRAYISPDKKSLLPLGYFLRVAPGGQSHFGTGAWCPDGETLRRVRDYIAETWEELDELLEQSGLALGGEKLKRVPRDYEPEHPAGEYLKHKSWLFNVDIPDEALTNFDSFTRLIGGYIDRMEPLRRYFQRALEERRVSMWDRLYKTGVSE